MNIRSFIYYIITNTLKKCIHTRLFVDGFSLFTVFKNKEIKEDGDIVKWLKTTGIKVAVLTSLLVFFVNLVWSMGTNNFYPDNSPITRTFLEDTSDLINYAFICPIYVTFAICFFGHIHYLKFNLYKNGVFEAIGYNIEKGESRRKPKIFWGSILFLFSTAATLLYFVDVNRFPFKFWYQEFSSTQEKVLSAHGYYYAIMTFVLMTISLALVVAHFELFSVSSRIGKTIEDKLNGDNEWTFGEKLKNKEELIKMFAPLTSLYVTSKILVISYLANMYTWRAQKPDFTGMLEITILAIAVFGTAVVSYPRYHIQYFIFKIWKKNGNNEYPEIRSPLQIGLSNLADVVILGSAMTNLITYIFNKSNINIKLF
jgi:hypothetical protein